MAETVLVARIILKQRRIGRNEEMIRRNGQIASVIATKTTGIVGVRTTTSEVENLIGATETSGMMTCRMRQCQLFENLRCKSEQPR